MNRSKFITSLLMLGGTAVLPPQLKAKVAYQKVFLHQFYIRGFQYYKGPKLMSQLQQYNIVKLVREPDNAYDKFAIAIYYQDQKLGFVPMEDNLILSRLLDAQLLDVHAQIVAVDPKQEDWKKVSIQVFALQSDKVLLNSNQRGVGLDTSSFSWVDRNNRLFKYHLEHLEAEKKQIQAISNLYKSHDIGLKPLFNDESAYLVAVEQGRFAINRKTLSVKDFNRFCELLEGQVLELSHVFDAEGWVAANMRYIASVPEQIETIVRHVDNQSQNFYKIVLKS